MAKTLSAFTTPHAAATTLESFFLNVTNLINSTVTAISHAVGSAVTAINRAVTTTVSAISSTITNLLTTVGLIPKSNKAPTVVNDGITTAEDTPITVSVDTLLGNDSDVDGDTTTITGISTPARGTAVLNGATVTYTPNENYTGADSFTYTVSDGHGGTATGTVAVTVTPANDAPTAGVNALSTPEDTPVSITTATLLGNDSDVDGDTLMVSGVSVPAHGSVVLNGATVTYTPNENYTGTDSFTYTVSDGHNGTATGTVAVTVTPVNDAPVAVGNSLNTTENAPVSVSASTLLSNDSDIDGDTLTISGVSSPTHGSVVLNGATVTYTPNQNYAGGDSFNYTVSDGHGGIATAAVSITVTAVEHAPVAGSDSLSTAEDNSVSVTASTLLGNDSDVDGDTLTVTGIGQPTHGLAVLNGTTVTYTPAVDFNGVDSLSYTVSDGHGGTATGMVSVTVTPVNDAPVAGGNSVTTAEDTPVSVTVGTLLGNDSDVDGDTLTVTGIGQPTHGLAVFNGTTVTYTPAADFNGVDSLSYTVSDGHGGTATGMVSMTVTPANDAPVAGGNSVTTAEDTPVSVTVGTLLGNDSDIDGDTLTVTGIGQPTHGLAVFNGTTVTYTPAADFNGVDSLTYTVSDGHGGSATAMLSVTVTPVGDAPVAVNDSATTAPNIPVTINVLGNDTDVDGDLLSVTVGGTPAHGTVVANEDGTVTYTPDENYTGTDSFAYTIHDGTTGNSAIVTVTVAVPATQPLTTVDSLEDFSLIVGLAVGPNGERFVAGLVDYLGSVTPKLARVNLDGTVADLGPVLLGGAGAIAAGPDGLAYVAGLNGITVIDAVTGETNVIPVDSGYASHVAVGDDGTIYFTGVRRDADTGLVVDYLSVLDSGHDVLVEPVVLTDHDVNQLTALALGPDGRIYVTIYDVDAETGQLLILHSDGTAEKTIALPDAAPIGMAVGSDGTAYVMGNGRVIAVDPTGQIGTVRTDWPITSSGTSIAIGPDGQLYVAVADYAQDPSTRTNWISVLDPTDLVDDGTVISGLSEFNGLYGISVRNDGQKYVLGYISDGTATGARSKLVSVGADGSVTQLIDFGTESGAIDIEVGPDGRFYITDTTKGTVTAYDPPNGYVSQLIAAVPGAAGLAIGNGRIYVSSVISETGAEQSGALTILNGDGSVFTTVDLDAAALGVSVGPDGRVYVATASILNGQSVDGALLIFSATGTLERSVALANRLPYNVTVGPDGTAYVADLSGHIVTVGQDGSVSELAAVAGPFGLDIGPDGMLYVTSIFDTTGDGPTITVLNPATNL